MDIQPAIIVVSPEAMPPCRINEAYSQEISASNGQPPYNFAPSGDVPLGLSWSRPADKNVLLLSGIPQEQLIKPFPFTVTVTDGSGVSQTVKQY